MSDSPPFSFNEEPWPKIRDFLKRESVIPILGRGVITTGTDRDEPLYPWLLKQMAPRLDLESVPASMNELVVARCREVPDDFGNICLKAHEALSDPHCVPGPLLRRLAAVAQCKTFFTLGCDGLFESVLREVRGEQTNDPWIFDPTGKLDDFQATARDRTSLGYLFGKTSGGARSFLLWDADAVEFVFRLQEEQANLANLISTLRGKHLLIMGAQMSDWALRFLLRSVRGGKAFQSTPLETERLLADESASITDRSVMFYNRLTQKLIVIKADPIDFASKFCDLAAEMETPLSPVAPASESGEPAVPTLSDPRDHAVFISYASEDKAAAELIAKKLRENRCVVWFDKDRLSGGDKYHRLLEEAVKRSTFFLSVISRTTEEKVAEKRVFTQERFWASQNYPQVSPGLKYYYLPVVVDDTVPPFKSEHPVFFSDPHRKATAEYARGGNISGQFAEKLAKYQEELRKHP